MLRKSLGSTFVPKTSDGSRWTGRALLEKWRLHAGHDVPNFHRVIVHGSTFPLEWPKLTIDPRANAVNGANAFGPIGWTRMIQQ